jgi:hypothetical protein
MVLSPLAKSFCFLTGVVSFLGDVFLFAVFDMGGLAELLQRAVSLAVGLFFNMPFGLTGLASFLFVLFELEPFCAAVGFS